MQEFLNGLTRTDMCGKLSAKDVDKKVVLMGWVHRRRDLGSLMFLQLRDITGIAQIVFDTDICDQSLLQKASEIKLEYVIAVCGFVRLRKEGNTNSNMTTGEIEVCATELRILSTALTPPFSIGDDTAGEMLRLQYRYLDLRRSKLQQNLILRSKICNIARNYFDECGFCEIETPILGKSTPEGARDYLVPSRIKHGSFYALPQAPQLYKQLLMMGGMDRYYQIARCFRDEDLRANRQPEFTQIDMEMSFIDQPDSIINLVEGLIIRWFDRLLNIKLAPHFMRMTYAESMSRFGTDKPDLRYDVEIKDITTTLNNCGFSIYQDIINDNGYIGAVVLRGKQAELSRKTLDRYTEFVKGYKVKGLGYFAVEEGSIRSSFAKNLTPQATKDFEQKLNLAVGDIAFVICDKVAEKAQTALGALRCELASKFNLIDKNDYKLLWITEFPLLEYSEDEGRFVARHHPFTSPMVEDLPLLDSKPGLVRAKAYDIVINGDEMGGGSIRICDTEMQERMFNVLGIPEEQIKNRFGYFVDALKYGTPPHGGMAFGLDRLTMVLGKIDNIREVIAFPKTQTATCMMSQAPNVVDKPQLAELGIEVIKE
ncbi:MAG: aspartate--tRNA ligase [Clostridia bacterium]